MNSLAKSRIYRAVCGYSSVDVVERDGVRSLHLGTSTIQSSMRVDAPDELVLSYTRSMMAFLLFHARPRRILLLGLGGGSLARFILARLPTASVTAVEINPRVVEVAHSHFCLPSDDARLRIEVGDGALHVAAHHGNVDVIMVDAYDGERHAEALCSDAFYSDCVQALGSSGILVANLWASDRSFPEVLARIERAFPAATLCLSAEKPGNIVVFGFRRTLGHPRWDDLRDRARELEGQFQLEFPRFVQGLRKMNPCDGRRLLV